MNHIQLSMIFVETQDLLGVNCGRDFCIDDIALIRDKITDKA